MEIWARGGLGNQILEYYFGISYAIKNNKNFSLFFSTKPPKKSDLVFHNQTSTMIQNLFYLDRKINLSDKKLRKTLYWDPKLIDCFFALDKKLLGDYIRPKFSKNKSINKYTALHIRGTDKTIKDTEELYDPLIEKAKLGKYPIKIVTDDNQLALHLSKRHGIFYELSNRSVYDDWLSLYFASEIFSIYSTFSYSTLLLQPDKRYVIPSFENAYKFYKHADKEYLALSQFLPYCENLEILGYSKYESNNISYLNSQIFRKNQISNLIKENKSLSHFEKFEIINIINNSNQSNLLNKLNKIICNPIVIFNGLNNYNNRILIFFKRYIFFNKFKNLSYQEIPIFYLLRNFFVFRIYIKYKSYSKNKLLLRKQFRNKINNNELKIRIDKYNEILEKKGILKLDNIGNLSIIFSKYFNRLNDSNRKINIISNILLRLKFLIIIIKNRSLRYIFCSLLGIDYFDLFYRIILKENKFQNNSGELNINFTQSNRIKLLGYSLVYISKQDENLESIIKYIKYSHILSKNRLEIADYCFLKNIFKIKSERKIDNKNKKLNPLIEQERYSNLEYNEEIQISKSSFFIIDNLLLFKLNQNLLNKNIYIF